MDTNTNFKISIPKPCHEDWNKFTPDEKGAFCKVCSKSVHDFTKKTVKEIQTVLVEEMSAGNKVCGRFNEDQLSPSCEPIPALDTYSLNFQRLKKFALALFLVFGGFLFNSTKSTAQKIMGKMAMPQYHQPVRGEIAISKDPEPQVQGDIKVADVKTDSAKTTQPKPKVYPKCGLMLKGDVMAEPIEDKYILGGVSAMPVEPPTPPTVKGNAIIEPTVVGQMVIETVPTIEDPIETTVGEVMVMPVDEPITGDTTVTVVEDYQMMGFVVAIPDYIDTPTLIDPIPSDSIQQIVDGEFAVEESTDIASPQPSPEGEGANKVLPEGEDLGGDLEVYPNPSSNGQITRRYNLKKDGTASISLFDLNGNLVKSLLPLQSLYASSYETKYDVSDLNAGIYFCELISGNNKSTTRIVISK